MANKSEADCQKSKLRSHYYHQAIVSLLTSFSVCWHTIFRWRSKLDVADSPEGIAFSTINVFT
ncbi:MAG: hypothetical protein V7L02_12980 [Nostoc sp.]|uniref:hypothetical protein n=1 Tax=Nostoc sp. TaxID=1180 RepID=UPI002FF698D0